MDSNFVDEIDCGSFFDHIDDFIDFPPENECGRGVGTGSGDYVNFPSIWNDPLPDSDHIFSGTNSNSASDLSAQLPVPYEDMVQLEWLSTFVEDSFSDGGLTIGKETYQFIPNPSSENKIPNASSPVSVLESSSSSSSGSNISSYSGGKTIPLSSSQRGPQRARSKRPRPVTFNPRPAMHLIEAPLLESCLVDSPVAEEEEKKKKKKIKFSMPTLPRGPAVDSNQDQSAHPVRKCMHCEITKTPQWRAGPMGPKTLCNACGVRYKSGRLFPEYRPAASPTFVPSIHSNSHKKVVEMRTRATVDPTVAPPVTK